MTMKYKQEKDPSLFTITDDGFSATVKLNEHDRMSFCHFTQLPEDEKVRRETLERFHNGYKSQLGAKSSYKFDTKKCSVTEFKDVGFKIADPKQSKAGYVAAAEMRNNAATLKVKAKVKLQLERIRRNNVRVIDTSKIELTPATKLTIAKKADELLRHSGFADDVKRRAGIYSVTAQIAKLSNPANTIITLSENGKFIGHVMISTHAGIAYLSDIVVHPDHRNQGIGETLMVLAFESALEKDPSLQGSWIIAGGQDSVAKTKMYANIGLQPMGQELADREGFFMEFNDPGEKLLELANVKVNILADGKKEYVSQDPPFVEKPSAFSMFAKTAAVVGLGVTACIAKQMTKRSAP